MQSNCKRFILTCLVLFQFGCGMGKKDELPSDPKNEPGTPTAKSIDLTINPDDWIIYSGKQNDIEISTRSLRSEKLDFVKKNFKAPSLLAVTVPESSGFELYEIKGYKELEDSIFIHPKLYLNTSSSQGSIMGYKTGVKDANGNDLIEISVPVALVNGLVPAVGIVGSSNSDEEPIHKLPSHYLIQDTAALKAKVGKKLDTLPVCPELFRLTFENKEYWAKSPFEGLSTCPLNQFFRIKFQAPVDEMNRLLETATIKDSAVNIITNLVVSIDVPKLIVELQVRPDKYLEVLKRKLQTTQSYSDTKGAKNAYLVSDLEEVVSESLFEIAKQLGLSARISADILHQSRNLILKYFDRPVSCEQHGACATLRNQSLQNEPIRYSWQESELLVATLHTETVTALGAVANSNSFVAKPSRNMLDNVRKPQFFRNWKIDDIATACAELLSVNWPDRYRGSNVNYGSNSEDREYFKEYCKQIIGNTAKSDSDLEQSEGYYPFITSTTVYPGAWIKIDLKNIEELTTAKSRRDDEGRFVIESQVIDLLGSESGGKSSLSTCLEGSETACAEYEKEIVPTRDNHGDQIIDNVPCVRGEKDCHCSVSTESGKLECSKRIPLTHELLKYDCSNGVETSYCPYWKTNKDEIIGYDITYECHDEKVGSKTTFLCLKGCTEHYEMVCKEKEKKAIKADRDHLMCKGYDGGGDIPLEKSCSNPRYKCAVWNKKCTRYSVNEAFHIVHENIVPYWRPYHLPSGEYPQRFEEDVYLKFVSPGSVVSNCKLSLFEREVRGSSLYIKLPSKENDGIKMCDGKPLWNEINTKPNHLPKVYLKNTISYPIQRKCGKTEYSFITRDLSTQESGTLVPKAFSNRTEVHIGPIRETCRAESPFQVGDDLWFTERPPVRFSGRVSVLGRVLESIVTGSKQ